jgi:hypothetical protein
MRIMHTFSVALISLFSFSLLQSMDLSILNSIGDGATYITTSELTKQLSVADASLANAHQSLLHKLIPLEGVDRERALTCFAHEQNISEKKQERLASIASHFSTLLKKDRKSWLDACENTPLLGVKKLITSQYARNERRYKFLTRIIDEKIEDGDYVFPCKDGRIGVIKHPQDLLNSARTLALYSMPTGRVEKRSISLRLSLCAQLYFDISTLNSEQEAYIGTIIESLGESIDAIQEEPSGNVAFSNGKKVYIADKTLTKKIASVYIDSPLNRGTLLPSYQGGFIIQNYDHDQDSITMFGVLNDKGDIDGSRRYSGSDGLKLKNGNIITTKWCGRVCTKMPTDDYRSYWQLNIYTPNGTLVDHKKAIAQYNQMAPLKNGNSVVWRAGNYFTCINTDTLEEKVLHKNLPGAYLRRWHNGDLFLVQRWDQRCCIHDAFDGTYKETINFSGEMYENNSIRDSYRKQCGETLASIGQYSVDPRNLEEAFFMADPEYARERELYCRLLLDSAKESEHYRESLQYREPEYRLTDEEEELFIRMPSCCQDDIRKGCIILPPPVHQSSRKKALGCSVQ